MKQKKIVFAIIGSMMLFANICIASSLSNTCTVDGSVVCSVLSNLETGL